jgi:D-alanine-D-alanine ligase
VRIAVVHSCGDISEAYPQDCQGREDNQHVEDVKGTLTSLGHEVIVVPANDVMFEKLTKLKAEGSIDVVFNVADDGFNLNTQLEPQIPAILDLMDISYTGSNHLCLGNSLNKVRTKQLLLANGLSTPRFKVYESKISNKTDVSELKFPLIVKPSREDGSIGIKRDSVVEDRKELTDKVNDVIVRYDQPALVEEFIEGREVNVGILGREKLTVLPMSEIIFSLPADVRNFVPYKAKWHEKSTYYEGTTPECPADLSSQLQTKLAEMATKAYRLMGVKDYGRIDFRISKNGQPHILEVNPNPDISADAGLARMARANEMTYEHLIQHIVETSLGNE